MGHWIKKKPVETWQRELEYGPSWRVFWLALAIVLIIGIAIGVMLQEAQLAHAGLL